MFLVLSVDLEMRWTHFLLVIYLILPFEAFRGNSSLEGLASIFVVNIIFLSGEVSSVFH